MISASALKDISVSLVVSSPHQWCIDCAAA
jgi:hypothetical protein